MKNYLGVEKVIFKVGSLAQSVNPNRLNIDYLYLNCTE